MTKRKPGRPRNRRRPYAPVILGRIAPARHRRWRQAAARSGQTFTAWAGTLLDAYAEPGRPDAK